MIEKVILSLLSKISPEISHKLAVLSIKNSLYPITVRRKSYKELNLNVAKLSFDNPIGLAAGFDKNAELTSHLWKFGFGSVEVGAVTPLPQYGNEKPRLFRMKKEQALLNRMGFNNCGLEHFKKNLEQDSHHNKAILGVNIGKNKDSLGETDDYIKLILGLYNNVDYFSVNISSPNTPGLINISKGVDFKTFLSDIVKARDECFVKYYEYKPVFIKISPDLTDEDYHKIIESLLSTKIDGVILANTTVNYYAGDDTKKGGVSGKPLYENTLRLTKFFYKATDGKLPIISVGGVSSAMDVYNLICAGASLVQIYTAFVYHGFSLVEKIKLDLLNIMNKNGMKNIQEAIGSYHK